MAHGVEWPKCGTQVNTYCSDIERECTVERNLAVASTLISSLKACPRANKSISDYNKIVHQVRDARINKI